jgi:hypothetical protein
LIDSATPFEVEAEAAFWLALPFAGDRLEPFDLELEDRDPPELEPDRRALDFVFVWATVAIPFFPWQPRWLPPPGMADYPLLGEIINRNGCS